MALIQAAFARPRDGASRLMTFQSIAEATRLPVNEVEHLIMKALRWVSRSLYFRQSELTRHSSLDLIRGSLDQVDSTVDIKWVQPRVLDQGQLQTLAKQFESWSDGVGQTALAVDSQRREAQQLPNEVAAVQ